jgi:hypothetical protein
MQIYLTSYADNNNPVLLNGVIPLPLNEPARLNHTDTFVVATSNFLLELANVAGQHPFAAFVPVSPIKISAEKKKEEEKEKKTPVGKSVRASTGDSSSEDDIHHFYCPCCRRERETKRPGNVTNWMARLPEDFLEANPATDLPLGLCDYCCKKIRKPHLIIINRETGATARVIHVTSTALTKALREVAEGLRALDLIPTGSHFPYPGLHITEYQYAAMLEVVSADITRSYGAGGVKGRGMKMILFGQFANKKPFNCAHFINTVKGLDVKPNCTWSTIKVDAQFREAYPDLAEDLADGEQYPSIKTTRDILPGEELFLKSYGSGYWGRFYKEQRSYIDHRRFLTPAIKKVLEEHKTENLDRKQRRRGMKRTRND